jgi:hypothetical protein
MVELELLLLYQIHLLDMLAVVEQIVKLVAVEVEKEMVVEVELEVIYVQKLLFVEAHPIQLRLEVVVLVSLHLPLE